MVAALRALISSAQYGNGEQRSLLLQAAIAVHRVMSDTKLTGHPDGAKVIVNTPLRLIGPGPITVRGRVEFGVVKSLHVFSEVLLAARTPTSRIFLDDGCVLNNGTSLISEGASITLGKRVLVGSNVFCGDSNFHDLAVERRRFPDPAPADVLIGDDVFIGSDVKILKGCKIGAGSIIGFGAVLHPGFSCPPNSTVVGNPAVIRASGPRAS